MKQTNIRLVVTAILLLIVGVVRGGSELTPPQTVMLDLGKQPVRYNWDIGKHKKEFALELNKSVAVSHGEEAVRFELALAHPQLYEHFLESLSSDKGYTTLAESLGFKAQLGKTKSLSLEYDEQRGVAWVRLSARIRLKAPLVRTTDNRDFTVELETQLVGGMLKLEVRSLNISGVPGEIDKIIARSIKPINFRLSECLAESNASLKRASFSREDQALRVAVALPTSEFMSSFWCMVNT